MIHKLTLKELADLISRLRNDKVTWTQVRDNEKAWGLKPAREKLNARVLRFDREKALKALRKRKVIPSLQG